MIRSQFRNSLARPLSVLALACVACTAACESSPKTTERASTKAAVSGKYAFWPQFPDEPRIQFVGSFQSSEDVAPTTSSGLDKLVFGKDANKGEMIAKPYGVAMRDGKIYICDMRGSSLTVLDLKKKQTRLLGTGGINQLKHPVAVAVADDGEIYVADNERGAVQVFDASERYARVMGHPKLKPAGVAVHGDRLYLTDMTTQKVEIYNRLTGDQIGSFGSVGDEDGQFRLPLGIAVNPKGDVYVVDMMRCRVQRFDPDGKFISGFGFLGDVAGAFARPKHIAIDRDGIVYVIDATFQNAQMFDDKDRLLMHFGAGGKFPGAMNLPAGIGICEDSTELFADRLHPGFEAKRLVIVANQFGDDKVNVYAMGGVRKGYTAKDLAAAAAPIELGVGEPSKEQLKLQSAGPIEPGQGEAKPEEAKPAQATPPEAKPADKPSSKP